MWSVNAGERLIGLVKSEASAIQVLDKIANNFRKGA
jgi:hypothetical protein